MGKANGKKGRDTKYKKKFCKSLIDHMSKGKSYITWGPTQEDRISPATQYLWEKAQPDWLDAKEMGYALGLAYYEKLLTAVMLGIVPPELKNLGSKRIDLTAVIFTLKTRFCKEYGEKQQIEHTSPDKILSVNFV